MKNQNKVWFITGISRGLGMALAEEVLSRGDIVIGTSRTGKADIKGGNSENLHLFDLDVAYPEDVKKVVQAAHSIHGRIDLVVNNAGYGLLGAIEETSLSELHQQFDVNFFGTLYVIQAVLPFLREQKSGHIMNLTSIAGLAPVAGYGLYAASKFAVEGLTQSLHHEVKHLGIKVTAIAPGSFRTDFLSDTSLQTTNRKISEYDQTSGELQRFMQRLAGQQPGDPKQGAKAIVNLADEADAPMHLVLGSDAFMRTRKMLADFENNLDNWKEISLSTDFKNLQSNAAIQSNIHGVATSIKKMRRAAV